MGKRLFELILSVKRKCQGSEERIQEQLGLSEAQLHGLIVLNERQEVTGLDFAGQMMLSPSRGSRVLNALAVAGYVKTRCHPQDRRSIMVSLTPKGRRTKRQIARRMEACESRICAGLDRETLKRVTDALELLETKL